MIESRMKFDLEKEKNIWLVYCCRKIEMISDIRHSKNFQIRKISIKERLSIRMNKRRKKIIIISYITQREKENCFD